MAKLQLKPAAGGPDLACIQSPVNNGKTAVVPAVSYVAVGVTGAALLLSGVSALGAVSAGFAAPGASAPSPSFGEVLGWMQSMALNGMLSVDYPPVYRSFTKNFGFSCGLVPWNDMQAAIDSFRGVTGGNLTANSVAYLRNVTLVYHDGSSSGGGVSKRSLDALVGGLRLLARDVTTSVNGSETTLDGLAGGENATETDAKDSHFVEGIKAYAAQLTIPDSNMFMSILMVFAIVIAAIVVGILVFKLVLELWALCASFPKGLTGFRKRYWGFMGRTIVSMILVLYGVWTLYCVYQFTHGDSWGAKALAGVTLVAFTAVLGFFTFRIWQLARRFKKAEGDAKALFEDKETWRKYSLFYDQYKKGWWWLFVPVIVYMFARGCVIAAGDGHGLFQTSGQLVIEALMLMLLLWSRPYATKAGQWINIVIQVVRVLSVVCILVFVDQLGVAQTTKTVTGVVLIAVQSVLTAALAILIAVNAIIVCCRENPHRKRRKEAGVSSSLFRSFVLLDESARSTKSFRLLPRKTQSRPRQPDSARPTQLVAHGAPGVRLDSTQRQVRPGLRRERAGRQPRSVPAEIPVRVARGRTGHERPTRVDRRPCHVRGGDAVLGPPWGCCSSSSRSSVGHERRRRRPTISAARHGSRTTASTTTDAA